MTAKTLLIQNGTVVTMNKGREIKEADIFIRGDRIEAIGEHMEIEADERIDAHGMVVIPGLIQTHVHLTQTLFRGQADDLELMDWLKKKIWPLEGSHTEESNHVSAKLGIAELIKGGTTAIIDMETVNHTEAALEALLSSGMRAHIGKCMMDYGKGVPASLMESTDHSIRESERLLKAWHGKDNGRIQYAFAPRFVVSCTEELLLRVRDLAREYGVMIHTHASENQGEIALVEKDRGMRNIIYLHKLGLTGENLILAHCIWLDDEEMKILAATGTKIAHCPNSNLKLASGIAKIPELLDMGANISIGADGAPCNNNLDMFKEMRSAALIQKARLFQPTVMPAHKVFELATLGGAKAMGLEHEIGSIEEGKKADLAILDLGDIHTAPNDGVDIVSQLVYSAIAQDVRTTIIDGRIVLKDRILTTMDEKSIRKDVNRVILQQMERAGIS
ncbi:5-methylthioadenosine/S-adenosylhomocysteine deaminase [Anaerosolibacter carboniphilus]|uniref:5-methylthioadenosine/S-adenosylhomocysteine deaminase n=1 Tax=Anaerosolibacter carboniphilus TaxID=1417629 RepID=A0A841KSX9_9FIRM|nr:5'-deoxyadenosine deaminase [Anaerosolibacter carboniphilus]MBB6215140.1 5-methylthioadenosine/S-adenosylhomocysteine deaminase [Anaerosolibacter carboniphilus]